MKTIKTYCFLNHKANFDMYEIEVRIAFSDFKDLEEYTINLYDYVIVENGLFE